MNKKKDTMELLQNELSSLEGSVLSVCKSCSKYGKIIEIKKSKPAQEPPKKIIRIEEPIEVIVPDFSLKIKNARESLKLKQEELAKKISKKASVIHKLESGHLTPSISLAKKLESFLNIKLIEQYEEEKKEINLKDEDLTIGDLIKIKDKKSK